MINTSHLDEPHPSMQEPKPRVMHGILKSYSMPSPIAEDPAEYSASSSSVFYSGDDAAGEDTSTSYDMSSDDEDFYDNHPFYIQLMRCRCTRCRKRGKKSTAGKVQPGEPREDDEANVTNGESTTKF